MALTDMFVPDGKVEIKIADLKEMLRQEALSQAETKCMLNGLKAGLPARHILIMIGENEEDSDNA